MRRIAIAIAAIAGFVGLAVGAAPAYAQGGHFITGGGNAAECTDIGTQLQCTGKVAGLGGTTFTITVSAPGTASVECENPSGPPGNRAPGQDTEVNAAGTSGPLPTPRNGQFVFSLATDTPTVPNSPTCPNPKWTAHVVDVTFGDATLSLFENGTLSDQIIVPVS